MTVCPAGRGLYDVIRLIRSAASEGWTCLVVNVLLEVVYFQLPRDEIVRKCELEFLIAETYFLLMVLINLKVDVEYKIMSALGNTSLPVPKTYLFCEDKTIMGQEFYVMEYIKV